MDDRVIIVGLPIIRRLLAGEDVEIAEWHVTLLPDSTLLNQKDTGQFTKSQMKRIVVQRKHESS